MRVQEDQIYDMSVKEEEKVAREAVIEQRVHPGFQCFFKNYLNQKSITINECFYQLIESSRDLTDLKFSIPRIMRMKGLNPIEKSRFLQSKDHRYIYIYKNDDEGLTSRLIEDASKDEENLHKLERKLLIYKEKKEGLLAEKLEEFRKKKLLTEHQSIEVKPTTLSEKSLVQSELKVDSAAGAKIA